MRPLKIKNGLFHFSCINMYGIIHQNEKGYLIMHSFKYSLYYDNEHRITELYSNIKLLSKLLFWPNKKIWLVQVTS